MSDNDSMQDKHPSRICDFYIEKKQPCKDCMEPQEEIDFWQECYNGEHTSPADCPTWYDWCNCGVTMSNEIEHLRGERDGLTRELRETNATLMQWLRFLWKEYVLCDESELTADAKDLRAELLSCVEIKDAPTLPKGLDTSSIGYSWARSPGVKFCIAIGGEKVSLRLISVMEKDEVETVCGAAEDTDGSVAIIYVPTSRMEELHAEPDLSDPATYGCLIKLAEEELERSKVH
jgi:hypothetical protein